MQGCAGRATMRLRQALSSIAIAIACSAATILRCQTGTGWSACATGADAAIAKVTIAVERLRRCVRCFFVGCDPCSVCCACVAQAKAALRSMIVLRSRVV